MSAQKELVKDAMNAFFRDFDAEKMRQLFSEDYIQHNAEFPTGLAPVIANLPKMKAANYKHEIHRIFEDGDKVVTHTTFSMDMPEGRLEMIAFDIWRIENGKIAEHWDNYSPNVTETANGRTMVDGHTEVEDVEKTEANKTLMMNFVQDVMLGNAPEKISEYINTEYYHQHNPLIPDGFNGFLEALKHYNPAELNLKLHNMLAEGNFILFVNEGMMLGQSTAFYDLFRIKDGKIVEHWDVIQAIPDEMAHENGKF